MVMKKDSTPVDWFWILLGAGALFIFCASTLALISSEYFQEYEETGESLMFHADNTARFEEFTSATKGDQAILITHDNDSCLYRFTDGPCGNSLVGKPPCPISIPQQGLGCWEIDPYAWRHPRYSVDEPDEEFVLFSPVGKVREGDEQLFDDPCLGFQDYIDNPKECFLHYLVGEPDPLPYEVVVYLAPDGSVRWMTWKKERKQK